jgi:hydrogenase nickel incorporation protein HypB
MGVGDIRVIDVKEGILADNDLRAAELRERLRTKNSFLLNLMASPGAGKTSLILRTIGALKDEFRLGVLEADIESVVDSEKVATTGVPVVQLRTGGFCHLDAFMVEEGLRALDVDALDCIVVENVGNLVCPAEFDTGAEKKAVILSVPEGDDKPLKYPLIFTVCDVVVVNKVDYLEGSDFDLRKFRERVLKLNPRAEIMEVSCKTGQGIDAWTLWLRKEIEGLVENR